MRIKKYSPQAGFTILEIIASIAIIVFGMMGLASLSMQSLRLINFNKNYLVASELASEGLELIINTRDSNWVIGKDWNFGFSTDGDYVMSYNTSTPVSLGVHNVNNINQPTTELFLDADGFYWHGAGVSTGFRRMLTITSEDTASSTVSCLVQYNDHGVAKQYKLDTVIYNWK